MDSDFLKKFKRYNEERRKRGLLPISRREFIGITSMVAVGLTMPFANAFSGDNTEAPLSLSQSAMAGRINHDLDKCVGCGVCGLMCSLYHYGEQGPSLSRSELHRDPFTYDHSLYVCQQCDSAECYHACPEKDKARKIDPASKAKYVNEEECIGCGECIKACPLDPVRVKMHPTREVAMNCDLCRGRADGPICVKYCTMNALSYTKV